MALTKIQIVESIHNQIGLPKKKSTEIVETLLEVIKSTLASGEDVLISNFGRFCVKEKRERNRKIYSRAGSHKRLCHFFIIKTFWF